jgi:GT2 family glycosyltransferase
MAHGPCPYSIVVVTWNSQDHLRRLLASLAKDPHPATELIVVDNDSADDPELVAKEAPGPVQVIRLAENRGYGAAANVGVNEAAGDAVVVMNPDTELAGGSLGALAGFAFGAWALAGPRLLNPDGSIQPSASGIPVGAWPWVGAVLPGRAAPPPVRRRTEPWRSRSTAQVAWLTGACVAGPRELLAELGPFDPRIHLYAEDMELGLRAARRGTPSFICPTLCRVIHLRRGSTAKRFASGPERLMAQNLRLILEREYGERRAARALRAQRFNLKARSLAKGLAGRPAEREQRLLDALRATPGPTVPD